MSINFDKIYSVLNKETPLATDCGAICGSVCGKTCCDANSELSYGGGMILFPGEEKVVDSSLTKIRVDLGYTLVVCEGKCERALRPLYCRVFPLFPMVDETGRIFAGYDMRGNSVCPLLRFRDNFRLQPSFVRKVVQIGREVARDPKGLEFLKAQTLEIEEIASFHHESRKPICRRPFADRELSKLGF